MLGSWGSYGYLSGLYMRNFYKFILVIYCCCYLRVTNYEIYYRLYVVEGIGGYGAYLQVLFWVDSSGVWGREVVLRS